MRVKVPGQCIAGIIGSVALLGLSACGGGGAGEGQVAAQATSQAQPFAAAAESRALALSAAPRNTAVTGFPPSTWNPAEPDRVTIGTIVVGDTRYNNVVATFGSLISVGPGPATRTYDSYDGATGRLTVAAVTVDGIVYNDVVVAVTGVLSVGSAGGLSPIIPNDPLFSDQWHLRNTGQVGPGGVAARAGEDLNATMAWNYATGTGVRIAVVDDGIDINHEDLKVVAGRNFDYRVNAYGDPSSSASPHGTSCAGLAAARGFNGIGVTGVAYNASVVGYNFLVASTDANGADAVTRDLLDNQIYTNSYGSADSNGLMVRSDQSWRDAINFGIRSGRGGRGAVYTWAAGNGAPEDRSDYDGQANFQGVMAIGALNAQGTRASYSEPGSNLLVVAFGGESCGLHQTTTTDVSATGGYNNGVGATTPGAAYNDYPGRPNYTRCFNGTSAATPQVAGVAALMLETRPTLGWRDVRAILARTARQNDPGNADWRRNGAGLWVNHNYGFGTVNALAAVNAARTWQILPTQFAVNSDDGPGGPIADNGPALVSTLRVTGSSIRNIEFVDLTVDINHPEIGDLEIILTSPSGTPSIVSLPRICKNENEAPVSCGSTLRGGFRFGITRFMDEPADGVWTLSVRDAAAADVGSLVRWFIRPYGI